MVVEDIHDSNDVGVVKTLLEEKQVMVSRYKIDSARDEDRMQSAAGRERKAKERG